MMLTDDQKAELQKALETVLGALAMILANGALETVEQFKKAIIESLDVYGEFMDAPVDESVVAEVAQAMVDLASRNRR